MKTLTIRDAADGVEVLLYDVIGGDWFGEGVTAKAFREALKPHRGKAVNLRINSPGGDVLEAAAIMAALDDHKGRITADVDGLAASAASFLMMAADEIRVGSNALVMIHDPHGGVRGTARDLRDHADLLEKVKGQILDAYGRKSQAGRDQLAAWMEAETWFTGQEAVDAGLADRVTEPVRVAALAQNMPLVAKFRYRHAPAIPQDGPEWEATRRRQEVAARLRGATTA
jgi:ATP-dependent Clp protease protease subunit